MKASQAGVEEAVSALRDAIALHEKHMNGTEPTTGNAGEKSQQKLMDMIEAALAALTGDEMPSSHMGRATEVLETDFDQFADATEASLKRMADKLETFRAENTRMAAEIETVKQEQRSAPVLAPTVDTEAIVSRVAALVPLPDLDAIAMRVMEQIHIPEAREGQPGKDAAEVNIEEIVTRVAELAIPRITAAIPAPANGKDGEPGARGEDGTSSPEEIRAVVREEVLTQHRSFYKGVFAPETEYRTADAVTWDGSLWIAKRDTKAKPGLDDNWQLAVKKGRDGRK